MERNDGSSQTTVVAGNGVTYEVIVKPDEGMTLSREQPLPKYDAERLIQALKETTLVYSRGCGDQPESE